MKKTIYLVEDDEGIREMLGYALGPHYHVVPCENLKTFYLKMLQRHPDLIIMDIMLPDGNGDDAGHALQEDDTTKNIPVLFMSANMKFELGRPTNMHQFISKPFELKLLLQRVKEMLQ